MKYAEAFAKLGYHLKLPRQHWSAVSPQGVCVSLWRTEIDWTELVFDSRIHAGPVEEWSAAGKNMQRQHLAEAMNKFDGWVDVVVVDGKPGHGVTNASPWIATDRKGKRWRVVEFDPATDHYKVVAQ